MSDIINTLKEQVSDLVIINSQITQRNGDINLALFQAIKAVKENDEGAIVDALESIASAVNEAIRTNGEMGPRLSEISTLLDSGNEICIKSARRGTYNK